VEDLKPCPGAAPKGRIDGNAFLLGNHRLIHEQGRCSDELEAQLSALEEQGKTVILLTDEQACMAFSPWPTRSKTAAVRPLPSCTHWASKRSC
jgi:cation transport ATPase